MSASNKLAVSALLALGLAGCSANQSLDPNGYLERRDSISFTAGDAVASNKATMIIDPWPVYAADNNIAYNGQRMQAAVERYRYGKVIPPRGIAASGTYVPPTPDPSSAMGPATPPVGPTVTGPAVK
jgi:hypothetical protein